MDLTSSFERLGVTSPADSMTHDRDMGMVCSKDLPTSGFQANQSNAGRKFSRQEGPLPGRGGTYPMWDFPTR